MIELTNAIILNRIAPQEEVSFSYEKGELVRIPYSDRYIFEFLALRNQSLDKGVFKIDNVTIFPEEDNENSLFFLVINSLIKVGLCFVTTKSEKMQKVTYVQEELIQLRDLPSETNDEEKAKIAAIFGKINELSPSYVLVNMNEECNKNQPELLRQIDVLKSSLLIIALEVKPFAEKAETKETINDEDEFEDLHMTNLTIGDAIEEYNEQEERKVSDFLTFSNSKKGFGMDVILTFKKNLMVFFSFLIPSIGVIAFLLLSPLYGKTENKVLIIPFVITIVICFSLYMLMTFKCTSFLLLKNKKERIHKTLIFLIINSIVTLIGAGLGIVIFVLFKNFDAELKTINGGSVGIVLAVIFFIIMITACLYLTLVINKIKSLFKKKK